VKEKKTVSFKFSPGQVASFVGESNLEKIGVPDQSPIEIGNFTQVEIILENDKEMDSSPKHTAEGSPGIIFRQKRDYPDAGHLRIEMMPIKPIRVPGNRSKYFNNTNPKLQMRFDHKFTKIRQF
jgi:hypothetical protein